MKAGFGHIQFNINPQNINFYQELLTFLGWKVLHKDDSMLGVGYSDGTSLWFTPLTLRMENNYDGPGMNHFAFHVESIAEVDEVVEYLGCNGIPALFDTPRHRPEFSNGPDHTYYQVMFESSDRILFEIVYIGPR